MAVDLGSDLSCVSDVDPTGAEVSGRICLAQALVRRLQTPRGRLVDDPNYGYDVRLLLNDDLGPGDLARARSAIEAECLKDERVQSATAQVQLLAGGVLAITLVIQEGNGPFTLVIAVSAVTVSILSVGQ